MEKSAESANTRDQGSAVPRSTGLATGGVDLGFLLRALTRRAWLIGVAALVGVGLGLAWHQLATPYYESVTVAAPVEGDLENAGLLASPLGLASLVGMTSTSQVSRKDEALATLRSRSFLAGFVQDLDLMPVLFSSEGSLRDRLLPWFADRPPSLNDAAEMLRDEVIAVADDRRTGLIQIRVTWTDPDTTVRWAEELISRLNHELQARARDRAGREMAFLQKELEKNTAIEVRQAIFRLMETQMKTMMLANVSDEFALRIVDPPVVPDADRPVSLSAGARIGLAAFLAALLVAVIVLGRALGQALRS